MCSLLLNLIRKIAYILKSLKKYPFSIKFESRKELKQLEFHNKTVKKEMLFLELQYMIDNRKITEVIFYISPEIISRTMSKQYLTFIEMRTSI